MEYSINVSDLPSRVSMTSLPSLEAAVAAAPVAKRPSLWKRVAVYGALLLGLAGTVAACGSDGTTPGDPINPIPSSYSVAGNVTPASGTTFTAADGPLAVSVRAPDVSAECAADADCTAAATASGATVTVIGKYDNATPGNTADDETVTVADDEKVNFGQTLSKNINFANAHAGAGLANNEKLTLEATITALDTAGEEHTASGNVSYTFEGTTVNPVRVNGCNVNSSSTGLALYIQCTATAPGGPAALFGNWSVTGGPTGTTIGDTGGIATARGLNASDENIWTYSATTSDGTNTSDVYTFSAPVDPDRATFEGECNDGTNFTLLQPESTLDAEAEACATEPVVKPTISGGEFLVDITASCVVGAYNGLRADERETNMHYNNGTTTATVCPDGIAFAQGRWHKN